MSFPGRRLRLHAARLVALAAAGAAISASAAAQSTAAPPAAPPAAPTAAPTGDECFAFAFGGWTPPLDARAAGHHSASRADTTPQAPNGREWAMRLESRRDTTLMLFPAWWPAGVAIRFPQGILATDDTARGTAVALVADGRVTAPKAAVRLWRVPCGAPRPAGADGSREHLPLPTPR